jgi:hypothetical protein
MGTTRREALGFLATALVGSVVPRLLLAQDKPEPSTKPSAMGMPSDLGPGKKFGFDGRAQRFPGNTIICHLNQPGRQLDALQQVYADLHAKIGDEQMTWLPPSSYHMTVFDGALNARRLPGAWPHGLPLDASIDECNEYLANRLRHFDLDFAPPIRMVPDESQLTPAWTAIPLRPVDESENRRLRNLRDRLSKVTGIHHADHDHYAFHTTFGYRLQPLSSSNEAAYVKEVAMAARKLRERVPVLEMGAPEYCVFDDMLAFHTQFLLK